jgi:hypothetical protein
MKSKPTSAHRETLLAIARETLGIHTFELTGKPTTFSASTGVAAATPPVPGYVGQLDLRSGALLPLVTNLVSPHGMAFVSTDDSQQ